MTPRLLDTLCLLATSETRQSKYWEKRDDSSPQVLREEGPSFSAGAEGLSPVLQLLREETLSFSTVSQVADVPLPR